MQITTVTCDVCKKVEGVTITKYNQRIETDGRGWGKITLSGMAYDKDNKYTAVPQRQMDICPTCIDTKFLPKSPDAPEPTLQEKLEIAFADWIEDLAIDAVESAMENR